MDANEKKHQYRMITLKISPSFIWLELMNMTTRENLKP